MFYAYFIWIWTIFVLSTKNDKMSRFLAKFHFFTKTKCCQNRNFCFIPFVMAGDDQNISKKFLVNVFVLYSFNKSLVGKKKLKNFFKWFFVNFTNFTLFEINIISKKQIFLVVKKRGFWKKTKTCWNVCKFVTNRQNEKKKKIQK